MTEHRESIHEAAWPDMFQSLQKAYSELSRTERDLERHASEVREARDLFAQVIESMSEALFLLDVSGVVLQVNGAAERLMGATCDDLLGKPFPLVSGNPDIPFTPWRIAERRKGGEKPSDFDTEVVKRDGDRVPVLVSSSEVRDEDGSVRGVLIVARDMTDRKIAQDRLRESLQQKEVLLQEVHHRVKNNLQLMASLLRLQAREQDDPRLRSALQDSRNRVMALARLHELLYRAEGIGTVDFSAYVRRLVRDIVAALGADRIRVEVDADPLDVPLDTAIPCGLIVNELITNSLEHAFPDNRTGTVEVRVARLPSGGARITVSDDGVGIGSTEANANSGNVGLTLVRTLVEQVGGTVEVRKDQGTSITVDVPPAAIVIAPSDPATANPSSTSG